MKIKVEKRDDGWWHVNMIRPDGILWHAKVFYTKFFAMRYGIKLSLLDPPKDYTDWCRMASNGYKNNTYLFEGGKKIDG